MGDLTKNFNRSEYECKCGCGLDRVHPALSSLVQKIRDIVDEPVMINSGCRCQKHNANVGGVPDSRHVKCMAADIRANTISAATLHDTILAAHNAGLLPELGGIGGYDTFVHVDVDYGPEGRLRKW
jgi:uncharacterized protein YcbK (DUF882 family)